MEKISSKLVEKEADDELSNISLKMDEISSKLDEQEADDDDNDGLSNISFKMDEISSKLVEKEEDADELTNITIRRLDLFDVDDFMVWATDEKVCQFCSWSSEKYASKEDAVNHILDVVIPHPWFTAICLSGRAIGEITITPNSGYDSCRAEIGYVLGSKYWGRGIVTQAVKMAARSVFVEWPFLERLEALVDVDNKGSQRVLEKIGFQREGVLRKCYILKGRVIDMVMFSLLRTDPLVNSFLHG